MNLIKTTTRTIFDTILAVFYTVFSLIATAILNILILALGLGIVFVIYYVITVYALGWNFNFIGFLVSFGVISGFSQE